MDRIDAADGLDLRPGASPSPERVVAARRVLERDGTSYVLRPWQAGYLMALAEGRDPGPAPMACGLGAGWLEDRLQEAVREASPA